MDITQDSGIKVGLDSPVIGDTRIRMGVNYVPSIRRVGDWKEDLFDQLDTLESELHNTRAELSNQLTQFESIIKSQLKEIHDRVYMPWYKRLWKWLGGNVGN